MRRTRFLARSLALCAPSLAAMLPAVARAAPVPVSNPAELTAAIAAAKPGDEIVLAPGTYALTGASCTASGTAQAPIVVRSATPLAAKIRFDALEGFKVSGANWHFEGLDVRGVCANDIDCEHAFHVFGAADGFVLRSNVIIDFNAQLKVNAAPINGQYVMPNGGLVEGNEVGDAHARNTTTPVTKLNIDTGVGWIVRANYIHDFQKLNGEATYGSFMKSGGSNGVYERNLVLCSKDLTTANRVTIGLSFGGGGTGAQYCAPAYDPNVPCNVEHTGGTMRNNIIANCTDVGIYLNRSKSTAILYNTLVSTTGIDFRFDTTNGEARANVMGGAIRARDNATFTGADSITGVTDAQFAQWYRAPLVGDLRVQGDVSSLVGKGPVIASVTNDYCARARGPKYDLGALQHSLGDCDTTRPPLGGPPSGDGGAPGNDAGGGGGDGGSASGDASTGGGDGGAGGGNGASPSGDSGGCGCRLVARARESRDDEERSRGGAAITLAIGAAVIVRARRRAARRNEFFSRARAR